MHAPEADGLLDSKRSHQYHIDYETWWFIDQATQEDIIIYTTNVKQEVNNTITTIITTVRYLVAAHRQLSDPLRVVRFDSLDCNQYDCLSESSQLVTWNITTHARQQGHAPKTVAIFFGFSQKKTIINNIITLISHQQQQQKQQYYRTNPTPP
jgi:hypothetical protein